MKLKQRLRKRGYPKTIIETSLSEVNFASRPSAFTQEKMANERNLPFVTTYHPAVRNLKQILNRWNNGVSAFAENYLFETSDNIIKRGKSLKNTLVRSKIKRGDS